MAKKNAMAGFVRASGIAAAPLGEFALKGVGARQPLYAPPQ